MNKAIYLPFALLAVALTACTTPKQDGTDLKAQIDASTTGHYGQAMLHEDIAEDKRAEANHILGHIEKGHYWNINEKQQGLDAASLSAKHRLESEKELCLWLTEAHGPNHHKVEQIHQTAAYFKTGSSVPFKTNDESLNSLGHYLQSHPDATASVTASADTVGKSLSNQKLSESRANAVSQLLIKYGARPTQLLLKATGEGAGPDNTPNQDYRIATISTTHPHYSDCHNLK